MLIFVLRDFLYGFLYCCIFLSSLLLLCSKMLTEGNSVVISSTSHSWLFVFSRNPARNGFFLFYQPLWTSLRLLSGLWCYIALVSGISDQTVLYCLSITVGHRYLTTHFEFNYIFNIFNLRKCATSLFAWPNSIKDFSISLIISSKETWYYFSSEFSCVAAFLMIVYNLHIGPKTSLIFDWTVSRSLSAKVSHLFSTTFVSEWSKIVTGSMFLGTGFSLRVFSFRSFSDKKRPKFSLTYLAISPGTL